MAVPQRRLAAVPAAQTTATALRALSPRDRQAVWRLFGLIVGIYRRNSDRAGTLELVIGVLAGKEPA